MLKVTKRAKQVSPSLTLAITAKANKLKEEGVDLVSFGAGEPDFNTPQYIIDAAKVALDKGMTKYTASSGTPQLRKQICEKLQKDNNLTYKPNQIVVSNGAKQSLFNAIQVLVEEGDEVIILSPYWLTYPELVVTCGGKVVELKASADNGFKVTPSQLKNAINGKTRALIFNSPSNPTGAVYTREEITALAEVLKGTDVWVIADEIYEKLVYEGAQHHSIATMSEDAFNRTIVINGMSKAYSMTGWRIGYAAAPNAEVAALMDGLQSHQTSNANTIAQYASLVALSGGEDFLKEMVTTFNSRRKTMLEEFKTVKHVKAIAASGAFYTMVDVSKLFGKTVGGKKINSASDLAEVLIDKSAVAVIPCEGFGAPEFIRLSYTVSEAAIKKGLARIRELLENI